VKTKSNRLLLYTKTGGGDYEILLREMKQAHLAYHTYPLPNANQPRVALKGIPPNVTTEDIQEELALRKLQVIKIRQTVRMEKSTAQILHKHPVFIVTFQTGTYLREVYKTTKVCHCIVQWENITVVKSTFRSMISTLLAVSENERILSRGLDEMAKHMNEHDCEIKDMFYSYFHITYYQ
jgi:hypothetical protein